MVANMPEHGATAEKIWKLPAGTVPGWAGSHAVNQSRAPKDGKIHCCWGQVNNNMQAAPNMIQEGPPGSRNPDNFIVVPNA
ncbi:hypothetical protein [Leisingera sp.]|uniref:hypothetical protein n=1 Tax=Leisingera sp. TaxID=1879318 RepID=UPI002B2655F7|nr:hypothetical protein [Leisingera sp.]